MQASNDERGEEHTHTARGLPSLIPFFSREVLYIYMYHAYYKVVIPVVILVVIQVVLI